MSNKSNEPEVTQIPERMWIAVTALAASWTPAEANGHTYMTNLARAVLVYQHARGLAAEGFACTVEGEAIFELRPADGFGIGFSGIE